MDLRLVYKGAEMSTFTHLSIGLKWYLANIILPLNVNEKNMFAVVNP